MHTLLRVMAGDLKKPGEQFDDALPMAEVTSGAVAVSALQGVPARRWRNSPDAQAVLTDIIKEAKMANAIVQEVLDFVRPIRLQMEQTSVAEAVNAAVLLADTKARRGEIQEFTGVSDPYEPPITADLVLDTSRMSVEEAGRQVLATLDARVGED